MAKETKTVAATTEVRVELRPADLPATSFAVAVSAHIIGDSVIVSFGQIDPLAIKPGEPSAASVFERIAMGRSTFALFVEQSRLLLERTATADPGKPTVRAP